MKPKICKQCGVKFNPFNTLQAVCGPKCAVEFNTKKEIEKRVKVMKKDSQSLNDLRSIARAAFQTYIRMRDKNHPCISCGKSDAKFDAGHFYSAESYTGLIFNEFNCHKQCSHCNCQLSGNLIEYRKGLIKRYGEDRLHALEDLSDLARVYKFSRHELVEIAILYRAKVKELKNQFNADSPIAEQTV
jgi:hypothetical protein